MNHTEFDKQRVHDVVTREYELSVLVPHNHSSLETGTRGCKRDGEVAHRQAAYADSYCTSARLFDSYNIQTSLVYISQ